MKINIQKECNHPNCLKQASKPHPKMKDGNKGLCDFHYDEIMSTMNSPIKNITLTCPSGKIGG